MSKNQSSAASYALSRGLGGVVPLDVFITQKIGKVTEELKIIFSKYFGFKEPQTDEEKSMDLKMRLKLAQDIVEDRIEKEFTARLETFLGVLAVNQYVTKNKFKFDCLLFREKATVPFALIEFKRANIFLSLDIHGDQIYTYVMEIVRQFPLIESLEIVLTNGWEFIYGRMTKSYSSIKIEIAESSICLYDSVLQKSHRKEWPSNIELEESFIYSESKSTEEQTQQIPLKDAVIENLSGIGGHSIVYSCKVGNGSDYVLKAFNDRELFIKELENHATLKELKIFPDLLGCARLHSMLLYERFDPVVPTFYGQENIRPLEIRHVKELYDKLVKLHNAGYCHRDVRLENIILKGDEAFLIDIAGCAVLNIPSIYHGSRETASQRVLQEILDKPDEPKIFAFTAADDLESLFKVLMMTVFPSVRDSLKSISTYKEYLRAWNYWMAIVPGLSIPASAHQWHAIFAEIFPKYGVK